MINWTLQLIDLIKGLAISLISFYIFTKYMLPLMASESATKTVDRILEHPKIKPAITKLKELEPTLTKLKEINPEEITQLIKRLNIIIDITTKNQPRKIPKPPEDKQNEKPHS